VTASTLRLISFRRTHERRCAAMSKSPPAADFDDNPEWTDEDFARARPGSEVHGADAAPALVRTRGRPAGSKAVNRKEQIALRVDPNVMAAFKAGGPGWQTEMNEALWVRVEVGYSPAMSGWVVTVIKPTSRGRKHFVLNRFDTVDDAIAAAEMAAKDIEANDGIAPKMFIDRNRAA
jgi:uncharacterized protein (DUF4415 family)